MDFTREHHPGIAPASDSTHDLRTVSELRPAAAWGKSPRIGVSERAALRTIVSGFFDALVLALGAALVTLAVLIDLDWLEQAIASEQSVTEVSQTALLFLATLTFARAAWALPEQRGFLTLVAGLLACMLIREQDSFLDLIAHGFWLYPALATAFACMAYARVCRGTVLRPMAAFTQARGYYNVILGLVTVLVFSRLFGSGQLLWSKMVSEDEFRLVRSAVQEGLELYGYLLLAHGAWVWQRAQRVSPAAGVRPEDDASESKPS